MRLPDPPQGRKHQHVTKKMYLLDWVSKNKCLGDIVGTLVSFLLGNDSFTSVSTGPMRKMWSSRVQGLQLGDIISVLKTGYAKQFQKQIQSGLMQDYYISLLIC